MHVPNALSATLLMDWADANCVSSTCRDVSNAQARPSAQSATKSISFTSTIQNVKPAIFWAAQHAKPSPRVLLATTLSTTLSLPLNNALNVYLTNVQPAHL